MAQKNYKGNSGKNLWVNQHYAKGVYYSNSTNREGVFKSLVNWDIDPNGNMIKPRKPFFSALFRFNEEAPIPLGHDTYMFNPIQSEDKEFFIEFEGSRKDIADVELYAGSGGIAAKVASDIYIYDGDTIESGGIKYRLLGIDAPETYNDDGSENQDAIDAKEALEEFIFGTVTTHIIITAKYDVYGGGKIDTYGRHLVWLERFDSSSGTTTRVNVQMLLNGHARVFGEYSKVSEWNGSNYPVSTTVHLPYYDYIAMDDIISYRYNASLNNLGLWANELEGPVPLTFGTEQDFIDNVPIMIYGKDKDEVLKPYQEYPSSLKLPVFDLVNYSNRVNYSRVYSDLEIDYSEAFNIKVKSQTIRNEKNELVKFSRYNPVDKIPFTDSFVFIGTVEKDGAVVYEGLISLRYSVPLKENIPQFQQWYFEVETYKNNVFKIKYEDQGSYSPNLLDKEVKTLKSYYGQEAIDAGYTEPELIAVIVKNEKGEIVDTPKFGQSYTIEPIVALPTFVPNHSTGYDGYGIKWSVWDGTQYTFLDPFQTHGSNGWRIAWDADGVPLYDREGIINGDPKYELENIPSTAFQSTIQLDHLPADYYLCQVGRLTSQTYQLEVDKLPFDWDPNTIQIQCEIAKVKLRDDPTTYLYEDPGGDGFGYVGTHSVIEPTVAVSSLAEPIIHPYKQNEELRTDYQHRQDLSLCTRLAHFDTRLLLYGSPKADNIIYVSEHSGNIKYFPYKYALDRFQEKILYVYPYQNYLIVFSVSNIYIVYLAYDENNQEIFLTKLIMSNVTIKEEYINTVQTLGKDIVFLSNSDELKILRPNPYIESEGDLLIGTLSGPVEELIKDPRQFITNRFQYYDRPIMLFDEEWKPTIETVVHIYNNEIFMYCSVEFPFDWDAYMFILIYDINHKRWRIHDTQAMSFPYQIKVFDANEGPYILCRNSLSIDNGATLMLFESLNLWEFDDGYGKLHDSKPVKVNTMGPWRVFVFNSALTTDSEEIIQSVKMPIKLQLNPGYLDITPHLNKRFMLMKFVITNIDAITIPTTLEFSIDGKIRQTANKVRMSQITDVNDPNYGLLQTVYQMEPFEVEANATIEDLNITFQQWQLGVSRFGPGNKIEIKLGISGRGKIPSIDLGFTASGFFEFFNYTLVYKEQTGR